MPVAGRISKMLGSGPGNSLLPSVCLQQTPSRPPRLGNRGMSHFAAHGCGRPYLGQPIIRMGILQPLLCVCFRWNLAQIRLRSRAGNSAPTSMWLWQLGSQAVYTQDPEIHFLFCVVAGRISGSSLLGLGNSIPLIAWLPQVGFWAA